MIVGLKREIGRPNEKERRKKERMQRKINDI
jgi:hypothetical protein